MLVNLSTVESVAAVGAGAAPQVSDQSSGPAVLVVQPQSKALVGDVSVLLENSFSVLEQGRDIHFYSFGNFNLVRLLMHLLKKTGPAHLFMTSYSFSLRSIEQLQNRLEQRQLLSFRLIVDHRVKSMSPKPFQMLSTAFDYRCLSVHAKVALLWNQQWKLSVITSQNATDNPKMERGVIQTDPAVFDFDLKVLEDAFERGTT